MDNDARSDRPAGTSPGSDEDLVDAYQAAHMMGVDASRVSVMVDQGILTVAAEVDGAPRFRRVEVEAVRLAGA